MLAEGSIVDQPDCKGRTALHCAAMRGRLAIVSTLIAAGASIDARDDAGGTPADVARDAETLRLLTTLPVLANQP